ncbi:MAG TPA: sigma-70 family RNA polymerase sigma factor [Verrucomicrobiae bacterium]
MIKRLKNWQDQDSWQDFFDTYWKLIYGVAVKSGLTQTEAEDVVQETMVSVAKHMPEFNYNRAAGSFKAWLLNMTRWRITDQFRKRGPAAPARATAAEENASDEEILQSIADRTHLDLEAIWETEWRKTVLEAAMTKVKRSLDPQEYQIFDLYVNKEWAPDEVAKTFKIPVGRVYMAKHRVTEMMKEEVERLAKAMA